jgi:toxin CcdB
MAKFDVLELRSGGLVLDVQADLLDHLNTRVVVPLMDEATAPKQATKLNPVFAIGSREMVMVTQFLAAVPVSELGAKVTNLDSNFAEITVALDMLFQGF